MKCGNNCKYFSDSFGSQSFCDISGQAVNEGQQCTEEKTGQNKFKEKYIPVDRMGASANKNNKKK